jgi:acylphosphatase
VTARRVRVVVRGEVQGVGFRWSAQAEAQRLGLSGWVRNLPTGEVETEAEGLAPSVDAFVTWCRRGPPGARVESVAVEDSFVLEDRRGFHIRHGPG